MSTHYTFVRFVLFAGALVALAAAVATWRLELPVALGLLVLALAAGGVAIRLGRRPSASEEAPPAASPSDAGGQAPAGDERLHETAQDNPGRHDPPVMSEPLLRFAKDLVAATSTDAFRQVITSNLPKLLDASRMFVVSRAPRSRPIVVVARQGPPEGERMLGGEPREWTTFPLCLDDAQVGVLGIETSGGAQPRVRRVVPIIAPMIAQAMVTAEAVDRLRQTSLVDLLTGLATRTEGAARMASEIKRAQRSGMPMAVLMLDLDRFKSVNDRFGHAVGDAMLGAVGRVIMRTLRASDIRVRWGGEEFLIVLPETDLPRAQVVASGLLREIAKTTVTTPEGATHTTTSIGITISRPGETDAPAMIRRADAALYHAKAAGRACIRVVLGDRSGEATGVPLPVPQQAVTLPFPDRRNPQRADRRRVPSPGRRRTDPHEYSTHDDRRVS